MTHLVVADVEAPAIDDVDRHHVERVLRVRVGEALTVTDGAGSVRACRLGTGLVLEPDGDVVRVERPAPAVTIGFSVLKGDRTALVVQKLTELGVDRIVPFVSARSVVKEARLDRLRRVVREAVMQSCGAWIPQLDDVARFEEAADRAGTCLATLSARSGPTLALPCVLVGPEGGFTEEEERDRPAVSLGPNVLRAETAAVAAGALLTGLRARIVAEGPRF